MWTYLAYILDKYTQITGKSELDIQELYRFHADILWLRLHLTFWENLNDLRGDVDFLKRLKVIDTKPEPVDTIVIVDREGLSQIYDIVNKPSIKLFNEYRNRIDKGIGIWLKGEESVE